MSEPIDTILSDWAAAERTGDTEQLSALLTDDFYGVGPLGFVLPRSAWLARSDQGLAYEAFGLDEIEVHPYRDIALVTARNNCRGTFRGQPLPEAVRATLVVTANGGPRRLAAVHMSFIAGTPGSPPLPGAPSPPAASGRAEPSAGEGLTGQGEGESQ